MERVGLLIAVLDNITASLHNIISQMCRPYRTWHARRRPCAGVLIMSENQGKKRCTSICKSKTSKQQKHWTPFCSGLRSVLHMRRRQNTQKCRKIHPVISSIWTERNFRTVLCTQNVRSSKILPLPYERSLSFFRVWYSPWVSVLAHRPHIFPSSLRHS